METVGQEKNKKNIWYTSDLHWDHRRIIELSNRPFHDLNHMQHTLVDNWNKLIHDRDDVYVLGDTCFSVDAFVKLMSKLSGHIHIIKGNHDYRAVIKADKYYDFDKITFHQQDIVEIKDSGKNVVLCHYPIFEWNKWYRGAIHLHGHTHSNIGKSFRPNAYDVGVDARNFKPVTLEMLLESNPKCCDCMHRNVCKEYKRIDIISNRNNCNEGKLKER